MRPIIYPYKMSSNSGKVLAKALKTKRVYPDRNYKPKHNHLIINWGCSSYANWHINPDSILNKPMNVDLACNKRDTLFQLHFAGIPVPDFTTSRAVAQGYLSDGHTVVVRRLLNSHSGKGIVVVSPSENGSQELPEAPLYVKYVKKNREYRVHVFKDKVIDVQQKKKRRGINEVDYKVRNHKNGWVYCREGIELPDGMMETAIKAVDVLGLDFGAVDIIYNDHYKQEYVLEVNTAPGLYGTTLERYVYAIKELLR